MSNKVSTLIEEGLAKAKHYLKTTRYINLTDIEIRELLKMAKRHHIPYDDLRDLEKKWENYEKLLKEAAYYCVNGDFISYDPGGLSQAIEDAIEKEKEGQSEITKDFWYSRTIVE